MQNLQACIAAAMLMCGVSDLSAEPFVQSDGWQKSTEIWSMRNNPHEILIIDADHTCTLGNTPPGLCNRGFWKRVDLKPHGVTSDATNALVSLRFTISHNGNPGNCEAWVTLRHPDSTRPPDGYQDKRIVIPVDGRRNGRQFVVPLKNGEFDVLWDYTPQYCPPHVRIEGYLVEWRR